MNHNRFFEKTQKIILGEIRPHGLEEAGVAHELHFLDVPDDVCKARLRLRNEIGEHEFAATDEQFDLITGRFVPPGPEEGFNVIVHRS